MKHRICSNKTYNRLKNSVLTKVDSSSWSQENITFLGMLIAYSQPDMLSEEPVVEDICFAVWPFYLLK